MSERQYFTWRMFAEGQAADENRFYRGHDPNMQKQVVMDGPGFRQRVHYRDVLLCTRALPSLVTHASTHPWMRTFLENYGNTIGGPRTTEIIKNTNLKSSLWRLRSSFSDVSSSVARLRLNAVPAGRTAFYTARPYLKETRILSPFFLVIFTKTEAFVAFIFLLI